MTRELTVKDATWSLMREAGMTTIFGNPGSTELPFLRDLPPDFEYVLGLQEAVVVGMADGYAQASRNAAFVNLHSAAGMGHAMGNLFTAFRNETPLVVTAGQQARSLLPYEPFLFAERATEFPRPYVKWAVEPARAQDVPAAIARAYYIALQPPAGPTFVSIPIDDWDRLCEPVTLRAVITGNPGDPAALDKVAKRLAAARNPAMVVGAGVARNHAFDKAIALAERYDMAVWAAPLSARCSFPEDHRLFAGFLTAFRNRIVEALEGHDLVIAFGGPLSLYHAEGTGQHSPEGTNIVIIGDNLGPAGWAPVGDAIVADVRSALSRLLAHGDTAQSAASKPGRHFRQESARVTSAEGLTESFLFQTLADLRPEDSIVVEEAPSSRDAMHDHLPIVRQDGFHTCSSGGLGHGLPAAIGVAMAHQHSRILAVLGDGSSMYAIQGLWTAMRYGLSISFIIINNRRYEALETFGRLFGIDEPVGTKIADLDFCKLAEGQGVPSRSVANADELVGTLSWSLNTDGPTLVEVIVK